MKKTNQIRIRVEDETRDAFENACGKVGSKMSAVVLDLCKAAIPYIEAHCADGRWRTPALIDEASLAVLQEKYARISLRDAGEVNHGGKTGKLVKKR